MKIICSFKIMTIAIVGVLSVGAFCNRASAQSAEVAEVVAAVAADSTAAEFFVDAPTAVIPTIDRTTRLDMIDYFNAGSDKPSRSAFGGDCRILQLTPESISFTTSDTADYTLSLLPSKNRGEKIIMLVRTLRTPAEDSSAKFYTTSWEEIRGVFEVPMLNDWLNETGKRQRRDVENAVPFVLAKMVYIPDEKLLTITNNLGEYIPEESLDLAKESLHQQLRFRWNGKKFVSGKVKVQP